MRRVVHWARALAFASAVLAAGCATCPVNVLLPPGKRALNALKNRSTVPAATDFDARVTLDALLAPGDDRRRWQPTRAGAIEGYVVRVHDAEPESANCFSGSRLDAHIEVARRPDAPPNERVIVEVTPPMRAWAASRGLDWSTAALQAQLTATPASRGGCCSTPSTTEKRRTRAPAIAATGARPPGRSTRSRPSCGHPILDGNPP